MATRQGHANEIAIRMYRVGFGDCFLLTFPSSGMPSHILIDCRVHAKGDIKTIAKAVDNVGKVTNGKLAVVVATHAHQDHISGFAKCEEQFKKFDVKEVWLPWTENPKDAQAARLKRKHVALTEHLANHFAARAGSPEAMAAVMNLAGNQESLRLLKSGFGNSTVRYLEAGVELNEPASIKNLSVKVLGPPRDEKFLGRMDPPKDQRFLRLGANGKREPVNGVEPFRDKFRVDRKALAQEFPVLSTADERALGEMANDPDALAFALDQALNNTSVVTLFTYASQYLLFPGDAQYGNWDGWIGKPDADDILSRVGFYKVGHHGSYNATPKAALQKMPHGEFAAMASTQSVPWASIPLSKLMDALGHQSSNRVVRSDSIIIKDAPRGPKLSKLPPGFTQGDFWFEYRVAV